MTRRWNKVIAQILLFMLVFSVGNLHLSSSVHAEAESLIITQANSDIIPTNTLRVHYERADTHFENQGLWLWGDVATTSEAVGNWPVGASSFKADQVTSYGGYVDIQLKENAKSVNFIVVNTTTGDKDAKEKTVKITIPEINEIWIKEGSDDVFLWEPASLPEDTIRIHYKRADQNYDSWGLWMWDDVETASEEVDSWPTGATAFSNSQVGKHGAYIDVKLKENADRFSFLVINRIDGEKDGVERSIAQIGNYDHLFVIEGVPGIHATPYIFTVEDSKANFPDWSKDSTIYEVNVRQYTSEGTFKALEAHLPRLKELGVEILWFMPIHPISEVNRVGSLGSYYAVADYKGINPEFGSLEDFKSLVDKAHDMDFKVVLDWVANHTGWDNAWIFNNKEWYVTDSEGNVVAPNGWSDVAQLNYNNAEMRVAMIDAMTYWVEEVDIDGYRADFAAGVPQDFWEDARRELDKIKPVYMLAEDDTQYGLLTEAFNSNYAWDLFYNIMKGIPSGEKGAKDIQSYVDRSKQLYPNGSYPMNFTTNHDTNSWEGTTSEMFGEAEKLMDILSFTLPGMPLIYSGQEVGLNKRLEFFEKDEIHWDDQSTQPFFERLVNLKKLNPALWNGSEGGDVQFLRTNDPRILAFEREKNGNKVVSILNLSADNVTTTVYAESAEGTYQSYLDNTTLEFNQEQTFELNPWEFEIFTNNIGVESININSHEGLTSIATKGGTLQLTADVLPTNATNKAVTWSIQSGADYATMSETGLVTAKGNGTVVVKATALSHPSVTKILSVSIQGQDIAGGGTLPNTPNSETNYTTNTGSSTGNVTKPSVDKIKGIVTFNEDSLKNTSGNTVTLFVDSGTKQILLPINAAELIGNKSIKIEIDTISIELPTEVLLAAQSLASGIKADKVHISLSVVLLEKVAEDSLLATYSNANTRIRMGSAIYEFTLSVITDKNESKNLTSFTKPITMTFKVNDGLDRDLSGVYFIGDNQKLEYVGGKLVNGVMTVQVEHFSKYAVLELDKTFNDVSTSHGAYLAIKSLSAQHIVNGTTGTTFEPNRSIARAEFAALLVRSLNIKAVGNNGFSDVLGDEWYADAVTAAAEAGIINGRSEGVFDPRAQVTRSEMDVMLKRAYVFKNGNKEVAASPLNGEDGEEFEPESLMTRAEAAKAIYSLLNN